MSNNRLLSNGAGSVHAAFFEPDGPGRVSEAQPAREIVAAAASLLSHFWSRPLQEEVDTWLDAGELLAEINQLISAEPKDAPLNLAEDASAVQALVDEYERLFVGPGQVPCPPYESFWREDVPVDIRRTLMGPCTADLKELYRELGIQVSTKSRELPDHLAIELEALSFALSRDETESVGRRLFEEHLVKFVPRLCRAVNHDAESAFYRDLAAMTLAWLTGIRSYFSPVESG